MCEVLLPWSEEDYSAVLQPAHAVCTICAICAGKQVGSAQKTEGSLGIALNLKMANDNNKVPKVFFTV